MRSRRPALFIAVLLGATLTGTGKACPALLEARQLASAGVRARQDLRLFVLNGVGTQRRWLSQPVQVDAMEEGMGGISVLVVPAAGQTLSKQALAPLDRIAFARESFGPVRTPSDGAPCKTERLYELQDPAQAERFAYLAFCDDPQGTTRSKVTPPVALDQEQRRIRSPLFDYTYLASNQLLFSRLQLRGREDKILFNGGDDADILLHLDVKNFFTLNLTNANVQSFVEHTSAGSIGLVERLQFFLKLLVFKIDLKMATTASFFTDAAHLPMVMDIPLEPSEHLNPGSGMLFNWLPKDARLLPHAAASTAVIAEAGRLAQGPGALAKDGLKACKSGQDTCTYTLAGSIGSGAAARAFFIDMVVPRALVAKGFYPLYVEDVARFKREAAWDEEDSDFGRIAMYFEVSGLPKGQHKMDYWIRLGDAAGASGACPASVRWRGAVELGSVPRTLH